jgi:hypothetical protein
VPTVVGCGGARQHVELSLTQKERLGLQQSARVLRETIQQVEQRIGGSSGKAPVVSTAKGNAIPVTNGRTIPRSAWQKAK